LISYHQFFHSFHVTSAWFGVSKGTRSTLLSERFWNSLHIGHGYISTKIHSNFISNDKVIKFWQSPSFLSLHLWKYFLRLPLLHIISPVAYLINYRWFYLIFPLQNFCFKKVWRDKITLWNVVLLRIMPEVLFSLSKI